MYALFGRHPALVRARQRSRVGPKSASRRLLLYLQALLLRPAVPAGAFLLCLHAPFRIPAVPTGAFLLYLEAPFCCTCTRLWARQRRPRIHPRKRKQTGGARLPRILPTSAGRPSAAHVPALSAGRTEISVMAVPTPGRYLPVRPGQAGPESPAESVLQAEPVHSSVLCSTGFGTPPEAGSQDTHAPSDEPGRPILRQRVARLNVRPDRPPGHANLFRIALRRRFGSRAMATDSVVRYRQSPARAVVNSDLG